MKPAKLAHLCWGTAAGAWLAVALADGAGLRINHTPSLPIGLWRLTPMAAPLRRGAIVSVCPPDTAVLRAVRARGYLGSGRCPGGFEPLLKPVIALAGDRVTLGTDGIAVNGEPVHGSARLAVGGVGRPIPAIPLGVYRVPPGKFWVLATVHPQSFDSRYFGALAMESIEGQAWALAVMK